MSEAAENQGPAPTPFQVLCHSLAAQVHMALGLIPDPVDQKTHVEIGVAKQGVDMLAMLEEKTKGNLDEDEEKFLGVYLTQVRMIFVERVKELQGGGADAAAGETPESEDGPTIITP